MDKLHKAFPKFFNLDSKTQKAISLYKKIVVESHKRGWFIAFLSGFAFDAHVGYMTRNHRDVDLMISEEESGELREFLEAEGHNVYAPDKIKGEGLKVDNSELDKPMRAHCDIHYFLNDEGGLATIPLLGKELKFTAGANEIYDEIVFLELKAKFLKPRFLLEEKIGWQEQIGLPRRDEEEVEREKIKKLIKLLNN